MRFTTRPIEPLADLLGRDPDHVWMSAQVSLWGWGEAARLLPGTGPHRMQALDDAFDRLVAESEVDDPLGLPGTGPVVFASVTFSARSTGSVGVVPEVLVGRRGDTWWVTISDGAGLPGPAPEPEAEDKARYAGSSLPDVLWLERVAQAIEMIRGGELDKVVLARDYAVWSRARFHPPRVLGRLISRFPGCHVFRVADLVGASPELLVRRTAERMDSLVLAGSAPSFVDEDQATSAARTLMDSDKDRWEHELAVRSVRTRWWASAPKSTSATLRDPPPRQRAASGHGGDRHRAGRLGRSLAELHPTAVGGRPPMRRFGDRGAGGWTGDATPARWDGWTEGRREFAIALRCAELSGARARLSPGGDRGLAA